jgi:chromosome segregation ATPase
MVEKKQKTSVMNAGPKVVEAFKEKAAILKDLHNLIREAEKAAEEKRAACEELLFESRSRQERMLQLLNEHVRQVETEKMVLAEELGGLKAQVEDAEKAKDEGAAELKEVREEAARSIADLKKELQAALQEKAKLKNDIAALEEEIESTESLRKRVKSLTDEMTAMASKAVSALEDKAKLEERLQTLQENWEKYVAAR